MTSGCVADGDSAGDRLAFVVVGLLGLAVTLPFALARHPIGQDLPAHVETAAQIRALLLGDAAIARTYELHGLPWPNALPTYAVALLLPVLDGLVAAKLVTALGLWGWPLTLGLWCRRHGRSPWLAALALPTALDLSFSYGFMHFIVGKPLFVLGLVLAFDVARRADAVHAAFLAGVLVLLFCTHLLLFTVAVLLVVTVAVLVGQRPRGRLLGLGAVVVGATPALWWWWTARPAATPGGETVFRSLPEALALSWSNLGDLHAGVVDDVPWLLCALGALGVALDRDPVGTTGHQQERRAALLVVVAIAAWALLGPVRTPHVSIVAERFSSVAVGLAVVLLPLRRSTRSRGVAVIVICAFVATAVAVTDLTRRWQAFSQGDMGDFDGLLGRVPAGARVATHYVTPFSPHGRHNAAWHWPKLVALRGGQTDDSFAWRSTCVVGLRRGVRPPRHPRLVDAELRGWDYLLVRGRSTATDRILAGLALAPVAATGTWRLFRIVPGADRADRGAGITEPATDSPWAPPPSSPAPPPGP